MAINLTLKKLVDYTDNTSFVVNKNANGSTKTFYAVFNNPSHKYSLKSFTPKISSVSVGGQNWLSTEIIKITYTVGRYTDADGFWSVGAALMDAKSDEVSEKDGTVSSSITTSFKDSNVGYTVDPAAAEYMAVKIYVESTQNLVGCEVKMSGFSMDVDGLTYHTYETFVSRTPSTCCTKGSETYKCSYCEETATYALALDPNNHSGGTEIKNASSATCTAAGYTGDTYCKGCGAKLSSGSTIAALGHSWGTPTYTWSSDNKTCTAKRVCGRCGTTETASTTASSTIKTDATCTAKGTTRYTATFSASWAKTQTKDVQDIPAKGHYYSIVTVVQPTETAYGYTRHKCSRCDAYYDDTITYLVTFKSEAGTVLKAETVSYGGTATPPTAPEKPDTAQFDYTFDGWYNGSNKWTSGTVVDSCITYAAQYSYVTRKYTVYWYNHDMQLLHTDYDVPYGTTVTYDGPKPTKEADERYTYGFAGWSPSISEAIEGDKEFVANFAAIDRYYTVRWVNAKNKDGVYEELETDEVKFETQPEYNSAEPVHPNEQEGDPEYEYTFIGWSTDVENPDPKDDTELDKVKGNITYTAIYEKTKKLYLVTIIWFGGEVQQQVLEYGYNLELRPTEEVGYTFVGWSDGNTDNPRYITVQGEATYETVYERISIPWYVNNLQAIAMYARPSTKTVMILIDGDVPETSGGADTWDDWKVEVINEVPIDAYIVESIYKDTERIY